ncbi:LuxR C-terminal-related transcriptional regulator [Actinomadura macra]|uniref:LuxR C-terminal-related transcriptional regulator n=1 Tax=Actinomadura macra TaxID=46164 RepID=UPI000833E448|nr:LuxR family transcriptional regulator [Actinomadura macra]
MLLIDAEIGMGRKRLLAKAVDEAAGRGFAVAGGSASGLRRLAPLGSLISVFQGLGVPVGGAFEAGASENLFPAIDELRGLVKKRSHDMPVLVWLDDVQEADLATLLTLKILPGQLATAPVAWIFTRQVSATRTTEADLLFDRLRHEGARYVELGPLDGVAVTEIVGDVLKAKPDPELLTLAAQTAGNPLLLVELLKGLLEEDAVKVSKGSANLISNVVPQRVRMIVQRRLDDLKPDTRRLLEVASILGRSFSAEDLAELLDQAPVELLSAIQEAMAEGVLIEVAQAACFRHELVWRTIVQLIPMTVRQAVHRQIGEILLERGELSETAAEHLILGTPPGDARALSRLDRAAAQALSTSPSTALHLTERALQLTDQRDSDWLARTATAVETLTLTGDLEKAEALARAALAEPAPMPTAARLRIAVSVILHLRGRPAEALSEADDTLAFPRLPVNLRDQAQVAVLQAMAADPGERAGEKRAMAVLDKPDRHGDASLIAARILLATSLWGRGELREALRLAREAVGQALLGSIQARRTHPRLVLASMLSDVHRLDEAQELLRTADRERSSLDHHAWAAGVSALQARVHLATGRPNDAAAEASAALRLATETGADLFAPTAISVLATAALRGGDMRAAARHLERFENLLVEGQAVPDTLRCVLVLAQFTEAWSGSEAAAALLSRLHVADDQYRRLLVIAPDSAAWLVRLALAGGAQAQAEGVVAVATELAETNPCFAFLAGTAAHARGLLRKDAAMLDQAAQSPDPWCRASALEDCGVVLAGSAARPDAVNRLDQALDLYQRHGAVRDAARVRSRLREIGVRRRHWSRRARPKSGWASLTDTEKKIIELAAQGLTNRQIAEQMFLSVHTIAFHLRHVFRKLEVGSRVELTRLALERDRPR